MQIRHAFRITPLTQTILHHCHCQYATFNMPIISYIIYSQLCIYMQAISTYKQIHPFIMYLHAFTCMFFSALIHIHLPVYVCALVYLCQIHLYTCNICIRLFISIYSLVQSFYANPLYTNCAASSLPIH